MCSEIPYNPAEMTVSNAETSLYFKYIFSNSESARNIYLTSQNYYWKIANLVLNQYQKTSNVGSDIGIFWYSFVLV